MFKILFIYLFILLFGCTKRHLGSLFPDEGSNQSAPCIRSTESYLSTALPLTLTLSPPRQSLVVCVPTSHLSAAPLLDCTQKVGGGEGGASAVASHTRRSRGDPGERGSPVMGLKQLIPCKFLEHDERELHTLLLFLWFSHQVVSNSLRPLGL